MLETKFQISTKKKKSYVFVKLICKFGHETGQQKILAQIVTALPRAKATNHFSLNVIFIC
jgi:hypothetical protein